VCNAAIQLALQLQLKFVYYGLRNTFFFLSFFLWFWTPHVIWAKQVVRLRVAYPGGDASLTGPEGRIWPDDVWTKSSLGVRSNVQSPPAAAAGGGGAWRWNVWRPLYIRLSLQLSLTLACINVLSKTLRNIHGASHVPAPSLTSKICCLFVWLFVGIKPVKLYSASCWKGSKPPGSGHTRAEAQTATCIPKTEARHSEPTDLSINV